MQNHIQFYTSELKSHQTKVKALFKTLSLYSILRLSVFILTSIGVYLTFDQWQIATCITIAGIVVFLFLLSRYTDVKAERERYKRLVKINDKELQIASGNFFNRDE